MASVIDKLELETNEVDKTEEVKKRKKHEEE